MKNIKRGFFVSLLAIVFIASMVASAFASPKLDLSSGDMIVSVPTVTNDFEGDMPSGFSNLTGFDSMVTRGLKYYKGESHLNKYLSLSSKEAEDGVIDSSNTYIGFNFGTSLSDCITNKYGFIHNDYAVFIRI